MKPTNETVTIELEHAPTGEIFTWAFSDHSVPARAYLDMRAEKLREQFQALMKEHDVPTNEDDLPDYGKIEDDALVQQFADINRKILNIQMDSLASILSPAAPLPEGYENKRELLEECISSYEIIPAILHFFSQRSASSTPSPADGIRGITFLKANGEILNPFPELDESAEGSSATG
jgi:hypothetical protein